MIDRSSAPTIDIKKKRQRKSRILLEIWGAQIYSNLCTEENTPGGTSYGPPGDSKCFNCWRFETPLQFNYFRVHRLFTWWALQTHVQNVNFANLCRNWLSCIGQPFLKTITHDKRASSELSFKGHILEVIYAPPTYIASNLISPVTVTMHKLWLQKHQLQCKMRQPHWSSPQSLKKKEKKWKKKEDQQQKIVESQTSFSQVASGRHLYSPNNEGCHSSGQISMCHNRTPLTLWWCQ